MRLIDADRALEIVRNQGIAHPNAYHLTNYATLILREAPTVDAVEVVRCRNCRRWKTIGKDEILGTEIGWCDCSQWENDYYNIETDADDFCSYGERKEGAE